MRVARLEARYRGNGSDQSVRKKCAVASVDRERAQHDPPRELYTLTLREYVCDCVGVCVDTYMYRYFYLSSRTRVRQPGVAKEKARTWLLG